MSVFPIVIFFLYSTIASLTSNKLTLHATSDYKMVFLINAVHLFTIPYNVQMRFSDKYLSKRKPSNLWSLPMIVRASIASTGFSERTPYR